MINKLEKIVKLKNKVKLIQDLTNFLCFEDYSINRESLIALLKSYRLWNKLTIEEIEEIVATIFKEISKCELTHNLEDLKRIEYLINNNLVKSPKILESYKKILELNKDNKLKTYSKDYSISEDYKNYYESCINLNLNPKTIEDISDLEDTRNLITETLRFNEDLEKNPYSFFLLGENQYRLLRKIVNYAEDLFNGKSKEDLRYYDKNTNLIDFIEKHLDLFRNLEIEEYINLKDKTLKLDKGYNATKKAKLLHINFTSEKLTDTRFRRKIINTKKAIMHEINKSYCLRYKFNNPKLYSILEILNQFEEKPYNFNTNYKKLKIGKQEISLKSVMLLNKRKDFNRRTLKPIEVSYNSELHESYKKSKNLRFQRYILMKLVKIVMYNSYKTKISNKKSILIEIMLSINQLNGRRVNNKKFNQHLSKQLEIDYIYDYIKENLSRYSFNATFKLFKELYDQLGDSLKQEIKKRNELKVNLKSNYINLHKKFMINYSKHSILSNWETGKRSKIPKTTHKLLNRKLFDDRVIYDYQFNQLKQWKKVLTSIDKEIKRIESLKTFKENRLNYRTTKKYEDLLKTKEDLKVIDSTIRVISLNEPKEDFIRKHKETFYRFFLNYIRRLDLSILQENLRNQLKIATKIQSSHDLFNFLNQNKELNDYLNEIFRNCWLPYSLTLNFYSK